MKIGLIPVNIGIDDPAQMIGLAQLAESAGFESVWTFEHVIVPVDYQSKYPYNDSGKMGAAPETPFIDPLIALTAIAAATKTIRLGTGVNILSEVNPLLLAKQAASLDVVSNGRFMLGVGIGWLQGRVPRHGRAVRAPRRAFRRLRDGHAQGLVRRGGRASAATSSTGPGSRAIRCRDRTPCR
jgi:alkanesulfonate monooxygenase SsuD/methylene tetrahydromethanopterin reductase-like flavin-dependent oxidoreductase (luciferase family)